MNKKYLNDVLSILNRTYGIKFKLRDTLEQVETKIKEVKTTNQFKFYDDRVIDFFKYKNKGE